MTDREQPWTVVTALGELVHGYAETVPHGYAFTPNGHPASAPAWMFYPGDHGNWWVAGHVDATTEEGAFLLAQHRMRTDGGA
jgi:hypothetical protein